MPVKTPLKQIDGYRSAYVSVGGFAFPAGSSANITTAITTALGTAANDGSAVPVQVAAANQMGVVTAAAYNKVGVWNANGLKLADATNNEVYGRVTQAAGVYTLSLFSMVGGVETAYTATAQNITFLLPYKFDLNAYPENANLLIEGTSVNNDPAGGGAPKSEALTVTALNTLSAVSQAPNTTKLIKLIVNNLVYLSTDPTPAFTVAGTAVTWSATNAKFNLATSDVVLIEFYV